MLRQVLQSVCLPFHQLLHRAVPDISTMADITHCSFVVPEIIEHQDIGNKLPASVIADELPELSYNVVEGATGHQKTHLVSSHNHVFNKKKTLKSWHTVWQYSVRKKCIVLPL